MKIFRWRRDQDCRATRVEMLDRRRASVKFAREEKARTRIIRGAAAPFGLAVICDKKWPAAL